MSATSDQRVVITGLGIISPLGNNPDALWDALSTGRSGVSTVTSLPTEHLSTPFGAEAWDFTGNIDDFGPLEKMQKRTIRKGLKVMCREIQMGVAAAQLALNHAGLGDGSYDSERTGAVYGSDYILTEPQEFIEAVRNCMTEEDEFDYDRWAEDGLPKVTPLWLLKYLPNMPASHIAIYNDLRGPNNSLTLREASPNLTMAESYSTIIRGNADTIIAGATGTRLHPMRTVHVTLQEEVARGNENPESLSRPFDLNRQGMVLGEGAGALVLERMSVAESRGAQILGELIGYGSSTVLDGSGKAFAGKSIANVLRQCLRSAKIGIEDVAHINAHGLSTRVTDREEAAAIAEVFGDRSTPIPVIAIKSYTGNLGAGSGSVETAASVLAMQHGMLPRVLNYETPDPECPIAVVAGDDVPSGDCFININVTPQAQASGIVIRRV